MLFVKKKIIKKYKFDTLRFQPQIETVDPEMSFCYKNRYTSQEKLSEFSKAELGGPEIVMLIYPSNDPRKCIYRHGVSDSTPSFLFFFRP